MNHKKNQSLRQNPPPVSFLHLVFHQNMRIKFAGYCFSNGHPNYNLGKSGKGPTYFSYRNEGEYEPMDHPQDE